MNHDHARGWAEVLRHFWIRARTSFHRRVSVLARDLDVEGAEEEFPPGFAAGVLNETGVSAYLRLRPSQPPSAVHARLARGDRCFAVWHGEAIVHAAWTAERRAWIAYLRRTIVLQRDEVFVYDSFTAPEYRGRRLAGHRASFMGRFHRHLGARRALAVVAIENEAGLRAPVVSGYREIGKYVCLRLGAWQVVSRHQHGADPLPPLVGGTADPASDL